MQVVNGLIGKYRKKLSLRDKLFKKFKSGRLNIYREIYKESRNDVQRLRNIRRKSILRKN